MERSSALDQRHTSPGYDAHSHEFPRLCRNTDEAFAGITSIVNGKVWTNALRAYRLIMAVLRHNFHSNGAKTYKELNVYLETARGHPTGRLWVDCFVKPTLLSLMFLRGERNGDFLLQQHCPKQCCHTSSQQVTTIMPAT